MSGNGTIRKHGETPARKALRYLGSNGTEFTDKQIARIGDINLANRLKKSLIEQHSDIQHSTAASLGVLAEAAAQPLTTADSIVERAKAWKLTPGQYRIGCDDQRTLESVRSKVTRAMRLANYGYSTVKITVGDQLQLLITVQSV